ncbi:hypothetical protein ABMZ79_16220, partial [Pseudomonas aeruginosa]
MSQALSIVASGMVSAVGLSAPASCAAIRCALDNFQETRFIDQGGEWLLAASVPLEQPWGGGGGRGFFGGGALASRVGAEPAGDITEILVLLFVS